MYWPNRRCWLPALAFVAALLCKTPTLFCQTASNEVSQPPAPSATEVSAQAQDQAAAAQAQPGLATAAQTPPSAEDLGDALMVHQRYQAAIAAYAKGPRNSAGLWNKMGIAYQLMLNEAEAARCYQASLRLEPRNSSVINNLGTIYDSEKQYGNAERMYRKALRVDPRSALIFKNMGTNLLAQRKYKKGWEAYKVALQLDPNIFRGNSSPRIQNPASVENRGAMNYYMAKGCVRAGMNDCAIDYLRMALNEGFTNPKKIEADGEFAGLRGIPAFQQLLAEQKQQ